MCTPASLVLSGQTKRSLSKTGLCVLFYYLEGHGDLVSRLIMGMIGLMIWLIGVINPLTKSPCPSKYHRVEGPPKVQE